MAELKTCPFCGSLPELVMINKYECYIKCKCGIEQSHVYSQKCTAIRHWNRRAGESDDDQKSTPDHQRIL